jgi:hypothetical protein
MRYPLLGYVRAKLTVTLIAPGDAAMDLVLYPVHFPTPKLMTPTTSIETMMGSLVSDAPDSERRDDCFAATK